jgi:ADP-ribosylglycohydrolase
MLGAIAGDIIGSIYEFNNHRSKDFPLFTPQSHFTDDTVLTVAIAELVLQDGSPSGSSYVEQFHRYYQRYPDAGYGGRFGVWARTASPEPYNSWGNGSAMRVSPIGFAFDTLEKVLLEAEHCAAVTHNHPEGIKGAQATAAAIFLARTGSSKNTIKTYIMDTFGYDLQRTVDHIRPVYQFNESCQETVPEAIIAFLESMDFVDAIRTAISLGGDSDTLACITGGIAEAFYGGVPAAIANEILVRLDTPLRRVTEAFRHRFTNHGGSLSVASM